MMSNFGATPEQWQEMQIWRQRIKMSPFVIIRSGGSLQWYTPRIGEKIKIERVDIEGLWSREGEGYINRILFEDVEWSQEYGRRPDPSQRLTEVLKALEAIQVDLESLKKKAAQLNASVKRILESES